MKVLTELFLFVIVMLMVAGCNNDVFVDNDIPETPVEVIVPGDDGTQILSYTRENLHSATLLSHNDVNRYLRFYDANGEEMKQLNLQKLYRIVYDYALAKWEITVERGSIVIHSYENATGGAYAFQIILDYGYVERRVDVEILPGELPVFSSIVSDASVISESVVQRATHRVYAFAPAEKALAVSVRPYAAAESSTRLELAGPVYLNGAEISVPRWDYNGIYWVEGPDILLNSSGESNYFSPNTDIDLSVEVIVPAGASQIITAYTNYILARIPCVVTFRLPVSGRKFEEQGTLAVVNPMDYYITTENDK